MRERKQAWAVSATRSRAGAGVETDRVGAAHPANERIRQMHRNQSWAQVETSENIFGECP